MDEAVRAAARSASEGESRRLFEALDELYEEVGSQAPGNRSPQTVEMAERGRSPAVELSAEDEELISGLKAGLARLAGLWPADSTETIGAVQAALDGAEFVVRGEILTGKSRRLPELLPSFVFLAVLPRAGSAAALRVAQRATLLVGLA